MVLLGEPFVRALQRNVVLKAGTLYRRELNNSKYVPDHYRVVSLGGLCSFSFRIDIYTKNKTCIYFMFVAASSASRKELHEKANNLLAMLKAAQ